MSRPLRLGRPYSMETAFPATVALASPRSVWANDGTATAATTAANATRFIMDMGIPPFESVPFDHRWGDWWRQLGLLWSVAASGKASSARLGGDPSRRC